MIGFDDVETHREHRSEQLHLLRAWEAITFTIRCPLPTGAVSFRTYWRTGGVAAEGFELPFERQPFFDRIR